MPQILHYTTFDWPIRRQKFAPNFTRKSFLPYWHKRILLRFDDFSLFEMTEGDRDQSSNISSFVILRLCIYVNSRVHLFHVTAHTWWLFQWIWYYINGILYMWCLYEMDHSLYELIYDWEPPTLFMFPFMEHSCWFVISRWCANVNSIAGAAFIFKEFGFHSTEKKKKKKKTPKQINKRTCGHLHLHLHFM